MQHEELADLVVLTVKTALAPMLERLAATEARVAAAEAIAKNVTEMRDRLVIVETKTAIPPTADQDVRDRVLALETKAQAPLSADILLGDVKERVAVLEARAAIPGPAGKDGVDGRSVDDGVLRDLREKLDGVTKDVGAMRERIAVTEVRQLVPGPAGKDGKDGADGMGWDDLDVKHDGERSFTFKLIKGERVKDIGTFVVPSMLYRGIYADGRSYEVGDAVTYTGSLFYCQKATSLKPDAANIDAMTGKPSGAQGKDCWALVAKRGRDGKDGRDGHDPVPVVRVPV